MLARASQMDHRLPLGWERRPGSSLKYPFHRWLGSCTFMQWATRTSTASTIQCYQRFMLGGVCAREPGLFLPRPRPFPVLGLLKAHTRGRRSHGLRLHLVLHLTSPYLITPSLPQEYGTQVRARLHRRRNGSKHASTALRPRRSYCVGIRNHIVHLARHSDSTLHREAMDSLLSDISDAR